MLAKTSEFKDFAEFAQDTSGSVRYMDPREGTPTTQVTSPEGEKEDWIPEDAYRVAHDFRTKCASNVSKAMMNTLLADLNKIWRAREQKQMSRLRTQSNREVE